MLFLLTHMGTQITGYSEPANPADSHFIRSRLLVGRAHPYKENFMLGRRVVIVDRHPLTQQGLAALLEGRGWTVCWSGSDLDAALEEIGTKAPHLVILDLGSGAEVVLLGKIVQLYPHVRVLAFSHLPDLLRAESALRAGAHGYLNKSASMDEILLAAQKISEGDLYLSQQTASRLLTRHGALLDLDPGRRLTSRELQVFSLIGQGKSVKQIAVELKVSPKTVETHREHIKEKLGLPGSNNLARRAAQWMLDQR